MKYIHPKIVLTADGSESLYMPEFDEHYHSHHGALQESVHVYIKSGLDYIISKGCKAPKIFELGMGTFLNTFLTLAYAEKNKIIISYQGIEKFPVDPADLMKMNYTSQPYLKETASLCYAILDAEWEVEVDVSPYFKMTKTYGDFLTFNNPVGYFDLMYFDAFGFRAQSEMWSEQVFQKCFDLLKPGGVLVTYAAKGVVRRTMESIGFTVERIQGAPGKREMMRAEKPQI